LSNYYIADLHFGHKQMVTTSRTQFSNVEDMEKLIISNWNKKVSDDDNVYILGDFKI